MELKISSYQSIRMEANECQSVKIFNISAEREKALPVAARGYRK